MPDDFHGEHGESSAEARYRQILDGAPDAMLVIGADGKIEFANA